jgi:hypothetical protein
LLGFAEPVSEVPPIEDFLSPETVAAPLAAEPIAIATLEPARPPVPPEPPRIRARVRDLPVGVGGSPVPDVPSLVMARPQNLVGRLGRRLGDVLPQPSETIPAAPAAHDVIDPTPEQKLTMPSPAPVAERGTDREGRPSLPRNRRVYRRATLPAEIEIDGVPCSLIDVSIGGFAATGVPLLEPNALVPIMIRLTINGIEVGTLLKARIVYVTQGRSSGRFVELTPSQMAFLRYIVTWRGESVGAVGTTTLLDAISAGAGRGFNPAAAGLSDPDAKSRWWAGLIGRKVHPSR